jgi:hypothetical protein
MSHTIPGASVKQTVDGTKTILKIKTPNATFSLRPINGTHEEYDVQVTCKDLPGLFKNSGSSSFGWFRVTRHPGRNAVVRPKSLRPLQGNGTLMWPHLSPVEKNRCLEYLEKLLRQDLPRIAVEAPAKKAA